MKYVTHNELGALTGAYIQDLHPAHEGIYIEATDEQLANWVLYQANATFDGLELAPPPAPPAVAVPQSVTMRQARLALLGAGLLDDIDAAINSLPSPQKEAAKIEWEYSQEVQRHNGFVSVLAPMLGLTVAQIDSLLVEAAKL